MSESETQYCDKCSANTKIINMHYFQNWDLHVCTTCIYRGYERFLEIMDLFTSNDSEMTRHE